MDITLLFPLLLVLLLIPLLLNGRRQRKQYQEMQKLQASLTPGDEVVTTSGLRANVIDTSDPETVELEIAPEVTTIWLRAAIRERINPVVELDDAEDALVEDGALEDATGHDTEQEAPVGSEVQRPNMRGPDTAGPDMPGAEVADEAGNNPGARSNGRG